MNRNSTIKPIRGECIDCADGVEKYLIAGRCQMHYKQHRNDVNREKKEKRESRGSRIITLNEKRIVVPDDDLTFRMEQSLKLGDWFKDKITKLSHNPVCMECNQPIPPQLYRHAVAHIFPKKLFISVAVHEYNYLFLGAGCGCHDKSHRLDTFSKMKVWSIAVFRFRLFEKEIRETHKYLSTFKEYADAIQH